MLCWKRIAILLPDFHACFSVTGIPFPRSYPAALRQRWPVSFLCVARFAGFFVSDHFRDATKLMQVRLICCMSNVIKIRPDAAEMLRNIADLMDDGSIASEDCTLIVGTDVFHAGDVDDETAATHAIFNMTMGIQKLMRPVIDEGF